MKKITLILISLLAITFSWQSNAQIAFSDDFESDNGWVLTDEFERGSPVALGGEHGNPDPAAAFAGANVLGYDLTGLGANAGDYEPSMIDRQATATSPSIDCSGLFGVELKFQRWLNIESPSYDHAYIDVSNDNGATWTEVYTNVAAVGDNAWSMQTIDISALADNQAQVMVRFAIGETDASWFFSGWNIDDLEVSAPTCSDATNITVSNMSTTTADVSWTDNNGLTATDYEYIVQPIGTGVPIVSGTATTANPQPLTGLTASTQYEVYLRAVCGAGDYSDWTKADFVTACDAFGSFTENFDATVDGDVTLCWSNVINSADAAASVNVQGGAVEFNNAADLASELILVTPELTDLPLDTHRIRFSAQGDAGYAVQIGTMDSPTGTFTPVFGFALNNVMTEYSYSFEASTVNTYVAIKAVLPAVNNMIRIDDFNWEPIPTCVEPVSLNLSGITGNDVTVSWTEMGTATEWEYVIQAPGTGMPAGAGTSTMTNPVTDSSLTPVNDYEIYVRAICGAGDESIWIGPVTFTTPCVVINPPYTEAFATYLPGCWEEASNGDIASGPTDFGSSAWFAEEFAHLSTAGLGAVNINLWAAGKSDWLISPQFDLSAGGYEVVLDVAFTVYDGTTQGAFGADDEVQLLYTEDGVTWNNIQTWSAGNEPAAGGETVSFALATTGSNVKFALWGTEGTVDDTEDNDFHIDNFKVRTPPSCFEPTATVVSAITMTGAAFTWTENNSPAATTWDLYIVPTGDAAPNAASTPTIDNDMTQNPVWIGGMADTEYDVYVRTDCGANNTDVSVWSIVESFRTNCSVIAAPYTEDFEDAGTIDSCWRMSGGENWNFSDTAAGNHIGNNGTLSGNTASDNFFAWVDDSNTPTNDVTLTSPMINVDALTDPALYFYLISDNEGNSSATLNVEVYDGTTWTNVAVLSGNVIEWTTQTIVLTGYTGDIQVRFIVEGSTDFYDDIAIDDFVIDEAPSCYVPDTLSVSNINAAAGTVDLTWVDINVTAPTNGWEYEIVDVTAGATATGVGIATATNSVSVTGLTDGNEYQFLVRAICGSGNESLWSSAFAWTEIDAPGCVSVPVPADGTTGISIGTNTFTWDAPTTGGAVASYDVYAGTTAALEFGMIGNTVTESIDLNISDYATTFYYQIVAKNAGGEASGCSIWTFTTVDAPGCGDVWTDFGGTAANYAINANDTVTFTPDNAGEKVTVTFTAFETENNYDALMIYDGPNDTYPLISSGLGVGTNATTCPAGSWRGTGSPGAVTSTDVSGTLTFVFTSDNSVTAAGWEANITCAVVSVNDLSTVGFNYYPNPVSNNLTMTANENITSVSIFNMLGQEVYIKKLSTLEANIDMSKLSNGTYFVKAQVGQTVGTFKVIKN